MLPGTIKEGEHLTVTGEVNHGSELDAFTLTHSDGTVINIRPAEGPPLGQMAQTVAALDRFSLIRLTPL